MIPTCEEAVGSYENNGGRVTHFPTFGQDPLFTNPHLQSEREEQFNRINWELVYGKLFNHDNMHFCNAIMMHITQQLLS